MSKFITLNLPTYSDEKGSLTVLEELIPFQIARIYWIYGVGGNTRGGHRHKLTRQVLIAISGEIEIYLNDGQHEENICLKNPSLGLMVEPDDWHTMKFSRDSILLVVASACYSIDDYIDKPY